MRFTHILAIAMLTAGAGCASMADWRDTRLLAAMP